MQHASRKKTRKFLLQKLYARIYGNVDEQKFFDSYFDGIMDFQADTAYMQEMFDTIVSHQKEILFIIEKYAPKFDIETMLKTNILALCIAIAEMLYLKEEIPAKVSINEAIELSKYFWDESSKNVVNGILNSFYEHIEEYQKADTKSLSTHHFFL